MKTHPASIRIACALVAAVSVSCALAQSLALRTGVAVPAHLRTLVDGRAEVAERLFAGEERGLSQDWTGREVPCFV